MLISGAAGLGSLLVEPGSWAVPSGDLPPYTGPNLILIRFGGGVRRWETIDPDHTYAPFMRQILAPQGTLFTGMEIESIEGVDTSHGEGTLHILTGKYNSFTRSSGFSPQFEPQVPTIFEYLRKSFGIQEHETVLINGEDRTSEEFYSFSNHHLFGVRYRCQVLSLYRFKVYLLRQQIKQGQIPEEELEEKVKQLQALEDLDYRNVGPYRYPPILADFWQQWQRVYGSSGLINPRGDRLLTELAVQGIKRLRPKFMMINYQDPDYVHWGFPSHYTQGISIIDQGIKQLVETVEVDPEYRDNTIFCIVPDCGRDTNPFLTVPYQHHFGSRSAHEIFALFWGQGIKAGQIVDRQVSQIDIAPTLGQLMGFKTDLAEGSVLEEIFI